jgi:Leucine-rich repeat (LRR) protein
MVQNSKKSGKLNISNNELSDLPNEIFEESESTVDQTFGRESISWWQIEPLTRLIAADNHLKVIDARINMLSELQYLDLHGNELEHLPFLNNLQKLKTLNLSSNRITEFPVENCQLPLLSELNLSFNELEAVPREVDGLVILSTLKLNNNRLASLPESLYSLKRLQTLDLSNNELEEFKVTEMDCLQTLNLSGNKLSSFGSAGEPVSLPKLVSLDLKNNQFKVLSCQLIMPLLKDLCLAFNDLQDIEKGTLSCLSSLESFDIRDCKLYSFPPDLLKIKTLKRLDITNNSITALPAELSLLKRLITFHYSGNPIRGLPTSGNLAKLMDSLSKKLVIPTETCTNKDSTDIDPIQEDISHSKEIILSNRAMTRLEVENLLKICPSPMSINLHGNFLSEIPLNFTDLSQRLRILDLSQNRITSFPVLDCPCLEVAAGLT